MSAITKRLVGVIVGVVIVGALIGLYSGLYLTNVPGSASAQTTPAGTQLHLAVVAAAALDDPHPTWVSYYAVDANDGHWRHDTTYVVPAHSLVTITIYQ